MRKGEIRVNGKSYFRACCKKQGIPCEAWFKLGAQNSQNSGGYVYHCPPALRGPQMRYAVNYIKDRELYVAWDLSAPGTEDKTVFRVVAGALDRVQPGELLLISKTLKHHGWGRETVYAFDHRAVNAFLKLAVSEAGKQEEAL